MNEDERLDQLAKKAAFQVLQALNLFRNEQPAVRNHAPNVIMAKVNSMLKGEAIQFEDDGSIITVLEPAKEMPINTDDTTPGKNADTL